MALNHSNIPPTHSTTNFTEPSPSAPDETCLMRSPRGMIVAVRVDALDAILNLARRGWTFVETDAQEVQR